jgi:WS/DGAT/MGAT family acyltransferase
MNEEVDMFLRNSDAFSWYMERDPGLRSTIVAVAWLDSTPDWTLLVAKLEAATRAVPSSRMRLVEPPVRLATPRWVVCDEFDLAWHLHRVGAPDPGAPDTVMELARRAATTAFDPARPLWEFTLVEGMEDGRAALIIKVHHSLADGVGGMQLALNILDVSREPELPESPPTAPTGESLSRMDVLRDGIVHNVARLTCSVCRQMARAGPTVVSAAWHPARTATNAMRMARSVGRMVAPVTDTLSPCMTGRSVGRELDMLTVALEDLKRAANAGGGTVNDGFLGSLTAGLRLYHEQHGSTPDELRVTLPISIRTANDPVAGNRITLQRFTVPVAVPDPAVRLEEIGVRCRMAREEPALAYTNAVAAALNLLPSTVVGGMLKHVDFVASNVPGFTFPVYLAGAEVVGFFPFGPTIGAAINATLLSYNGTCCVGVTIDTAAVPDGDVLMNCLAGGFEEVLDHGGAHAPVRLPLHGGVEDEPSEAPPASASFQRA